MGHDYFFIINNFVTIKNSHFMKFKEIMYYQLEI